MQVFTSILFQLLSIIAFAAPTVENFAIVLDPGHGGADRGTMQGRLTESEIVLAVSLEIQNLLKSQPDLGLHLTRENDRSRNLLERVELAQKVDADLFVSVHANSNPSRRVQGAEFYVRDSESRDLFVQTKSKRLENASDVENILGDLRSQGQLRQSLLFSKQLKEAWQVNPAETQNWFPQSSPATENKSESEKKSPSQTSPQLKAAIRRAPFYVVSKTQMPSVLIEVGFMSNPAELRNLNSPEYRKILAQKIYKAILSYKERVDKQKSPSLN